MNESKRNMQLSKNAAIAASQSLKEKNYWLNKLAGELKQTRFPFDEAETSIHERTAVKEKEKFRLSPGLLSRLEEISGGNNPALHMILVVELVLLLNKYTDSKDVIVATPIDKQETEGEFINTLLPLRIQLKDDITFKELLLQVKDTIDEAVENQNYPVEILIHDDLGFSVENDLLFDVAILLENIQDKNYIKHINFNMVFSFLKTDAYIEGVIEYNPGRYHKTTIQGIINHFNYLARESLFNVNLKLTEIEVLSEKKKQLLFDFNNPGINMGVGGEFPGPWTIGELFEEQMEKTPDHIAVIGPGHPRQGADIGQQDLESAEGISRLAPLSKLMSITYKELNGKSNHLAHLLRSKGTGPDTILGIMMERSVEIMIGLLGILKAGGAYLPIDPYYPQDRANYMLADSGARFLVTNTEIIKEAEKNIKIVFLDFSTLPPYSPFPLPSTCLSLPSASAPTVSSSTLTSTSTCQVSPANLAYVIYTSGTTGRPKGVMIRHQGVVNMVEFHRRIFKENSRSRISQVASAAFDAMAFETWPCLLGGACLCIADNETRIHPQRLIDWFIQFQITISFQPTLMARELLDQQWPETGVALEVMRTAGDRLARYPTQSYPFRLYNLYGPTEDTVWTTWTEVPVIVNPSGHRNPPPIGKPVANHQVYILNSNLGLQPVGVMGELCISGTGLARGYLNNPELTAEKFCLRRPGGRFLKKLPPWTPRKNFLLFTSPTHPLTHSPYSPYSPIYRTGDLARWLRDGNIEFLGRLDYQVKIRGCRVELEEIENQLITHKSIKQAVVIDNQDKKGNHYLCAYLVPADEKEMDIPGIKSYLIERLPDYMIPLHYMELEKIPLTINGKINRKELLELEENRPLLKTTYTPPGTEMEKLIANVWKELLQTDPIGINDNFFDIGGNSVNIIKVNIKLKKLLNREIAVVDLFRYSTIDSLARYLSQSEKTQTSGLTPDEKMDNRLDIMQETSKLLLGDGDE